MGDSIPKRVSFEKNGNLLQSTQMEERLDLSLSLALLTTPLTSANASRCSSDGAMNRQLLMD